MSDQESETVNFSLEKRIRYRLILVMLPLLIILMFIIHKSIHLLIDEVVVERLQHDALSMISSVTQKNGDWQFSAESVPTVYQRVRSGHYYILRWQDGESRSRSLWDKRVDPLNFVQGDTEDYLYFRLAKEYWVIHKQPFVKQGETFTLWVAKDISDINKKQTTYEYILAAILVLFTIVFVLWQKSVLNRGFAMLEPVQRALKENQTSGQVSFPEAIPQEIKALVDSINLLVERLSRQVARSRMSVGNLAHELKRPLQELQIIASDLDNNETQETLKKVTFELQRRIDAELKRARISGNPVPANSFSLSEEIPVLQELLGRIHRKEIRFTLQSEIDLLPFDRNDIIELLGNLLDNAWKYADSQVQMGVSGKDNRLEISIEDDGPGVPEKFISEIDQRGTRIDESGARPGDGLGLSICQAIVESYNGTLSFGAGDLGGLKVEIAIYNDIVEGA